MRLAGRSEERAHPDPPAALLIREAMREVDFVSEKPIRMPDRPDDFPRDLWPRAVMILDKLFKKYPTQRYVSELCKQIHTKMTALYCEAVETGQMRAGDVLSEGHGMHEFLRVFLIYNDPGPNSSGLSNQAWEILGMATTGGNGKLAKAIVEVQQRQVSRGSKPAQSNQSPTKNVDRSGDNGRRRGYRNEVRQWMTKNGLETNAAAAKRLAVSTSTLKSIMSDKGKLRCSKKKLEEVLSKIK